MRDLIKPSLFLIARLGLFLAVVAWGVGQWWNVQATASVMGCYALGFVAERGIGAHVVPGDVGWRWESTLNRVVGEQPGLYRDWFNPKFIVFCRHPFSRGDVAAEMTADQHDRQHLPMAGRMVNANVRKKGVCRGHR